MTFFLSLYYLHLFYQFDIFIIIIIIFNRIRNYSETGKHLGTRVASSGRVSYENIIFENDNDDEDVFNSNTLHADSSDDEDS